MDEPEKEEFLREFGDLYGYPNAPKTIDQIRATEFKRLHGLVYLDHAGATLYSESQIEAISKDLSTNVYGNPHSQSETSSATTEIVRQARQQVLDYCNASTKDYRCVFTSGATAALKLVGEAFPWSSQSCFAYTTQNHNSVLGIREYVLDRGASAFAVDVEDSVQTPDGDTESIRILQRQIQRRTDARFTQQEPKGATYNLFAFPSECNFSGFRFDLDLVKKIKEGSGSISEGSPFCNGQWMVLIDAAKGCATEPPDLSRYPADFVVLSFYKLFGYPTGLGALIVRNDAAKLLKKSYFGGGTVAASIADIDYVKRRNGVEDLFEDGTISFLSIASILHGHTNSLASYVRRVLLSLRHGNGANVCTLYGIQDSKVLSRKFGPVVSFNLKRPDCSWYGYREVEKLASLSGIQLRTGCFCNPGACAKYLGLSHVDLLSNVEAGHVCWDDHDILHGKPTGAVRVSFGYMSTYEDAKKFVDFITRSFVALSDHACKFLHFQAKSFPFSEEGNEVRSSTTRINIKSIIVYPIKSCGGFSTLNWPLSSTGLHYDREWVLTNLSGEILTQKKVPEMCFISALVDLDLGILSVESPRCKFRLEIKLSLDSQKQEINVHGQRYEVMGYDDEVNIWFSNAIGRPCTLSRLSGSNHKLCMNKNGNKSTCRGAERPMSFANEAQFLLISEESVSDLNNRITMKDERKGIQVNPMRFRPNIVVSAGEPYAEDRWRNLRIGHKYFTSLGGCNRCQMINIVHTAAGRVQKSNEPLTTLASYRRLKGKILFGILLKYESSDEVQSDNIWLRVGDEVLPNCI